MHSFKHVHDKTIKKSLRDNDVCRNFLEKIRTRRKCEIHLYVLSINSSIMKYMHSMVDISQSSMEKFLYL